MIIIPFTYIPHPSHPPLSYAFPVYRQQEGVCIGALSLFLIVNLDVPLPEDIHAPHPHILPTDARLC